VCNKIVYDVADFAHEHPGGSELLMSHFGKDITSAFNGGVYNHSNAARNRLDMMRCATLTDTEE
jgi:stearoyl-CoA desaturase (delta-9 desaturase)